MSFRPVLSVAATALTLAALAACSSPQPAAPPTPPATPPAATAPSTAGSGTASPAPAASGDIVAASQSSHALEQLGELGKDKGSTDQIRALAGQVYEQAEALDKQLDAIAQAAGVTVGNDLAADQQAVLADLKARSGTEFDQAWTRAVLDLQKQVKAKVEAVLNSPNASPEAKAAARDALAKLDALVSQLQSASGASGAATPNAVNSGDGGQATGLPLAALALLGAGVLLLGGAVRRGRAALRR